MPRLYVYMLVDYQISNVRITNDTANTIKTMRNGQLYSETTDTQLAHFKFKHSTTAGGIDFLLIGTPAQLYNRGERTVKFKQLDPLAKVLHLMVQFSSYV